MNDQNTLLQIDGVTKVFPGVRALGFALPSRGLVQVSMNVEDPERVALHEVVARVRAEAAERGVETAGSELVGLMPAGAAAAADTPSFSSSNLTSCDASSSVKP